MESKIGIVAGMALKVLNGGPVQYTPSGSLNQNIVSTLPLRTFFFFICACNACKGNMCKFTDAERSNLDICGVLPASAVFLHGARCTRGTLGLPNFETSRSKVCCQARCSFPNQRKPTRCGSER